jgi:hypothetical protein
MFIYNCAIVVVIALPRSHALFAQDIFQGKVILALYTVAGYLANESNLIAFL